jgi:hypothetical protein
MSTPPAKSERDYVIRDTSSLVIFGLALVVLVALFVMLTGDAPSMIFVTPLALLFVWVLWLVLVRPKVSYNVDRVSVVNILRTYEIPWARVSAVEQRLNIVFHLDDDTSVVAAGVSAPRGQGVVMGGLTGQIEHRDKGFNHNVDTLDAYRDTTAPSDEKVTSRWNVVPLAIGGVLIVAAAIDLLVAFL